MGKSFKERTISAHRLLSVETDGVLNYEVTLRMNESPSCIIGTWDAYLVLRFGDLVT